VERLPLRAQAALPLTTRPVPVTLVTLPNASKSINRAPELVRVYSNSVETAKAIAKPIGDLGGAFMLDGATYARGAELGFSGIDFYVLGRGGVLGDTTPDVVSSAFFFWNPDQVRTQWELARKVMEPAAAAVEWVNLCHDYGDTHLPELAELNRYNLAAVQQIHIAGQQRARRFSLRHTRCSSVFGCVEHACTCF